jgi:hypothetical protein
MEALGGRGDIAPTHSRPRNNMGVNGQHHAPAALYPRGKDPRYALYRRLGGPQRLEEKSFASAGDRTPVARSSSP